MKLEKPIEIDSFQKGQLKTYESRMLFLRNHSKLIVYNNLKIEELITTKKKIFSQKPIEKSYLAITEVSVHGYNSNGKFWGVLENEEWLQWFFRWKDMSKLRNAYFECIKEPLEALGVELKFTKYVEEEHTGDH